MRNTGTRGYTGYRGRRPTGRRWLVVLLVLIILAAAAFLLAQRYIVFETDGSYHFELPDWLRRGGETQPAARRGSKQELEIIIEQPEQEEARTVPLHAQELDAAMLRGGVSAALSTLSEDVNAVAVRLKTAKGDLLYPSALSDAAEVGAVAPDGFTAAELHALTQSGYYTIARLSALHDSRYAPAHKAEAAVQQRSHSGDVWYAPDRSFYLAPEKELTRQYLANIAGEVAALGFDELLFDEFSYPAAGRLNNIQTDDRDMTQEAALSLLADNLRETLGDTGVKLSLLMDTETVLAGFNEKSGQNLAELAIRFDRIYVSASAEQLPALQAALEPYPAELVPILETADAEGGSYLISQ